MPKLSVHGHDVEGEMIPLRYLMHLDYPEAEVLFHYARDHGEAEFEHEYHNYTITHKSGKYAVEKR
jgi:hypothetical protein